MAPVERGNSGRYRIVERIAQGGMAVVDRAESLGPGGFRRELVLKRILPRFSRDQRFADMFEDEARIVSLLNHPNIVQIYEFGKIDGDYFLAMEHVPGLDLSGLSSRLMSRNERFPIAMAAFIVIEVCRALDYAHRKRDPDGRALGIIHRDVSPANVLISKEGAVKLVDFGIARAAERKEQTLDGTIKGKVAFMSPEQIKGEPLDGRSDLFSAAIILYQLLAGEHPFATDRDVETIQRAMTHQWSPPSSHAPDVSPALDQIVMKATERDRFERYETAAEFAQELEEFLFESRLRGSASELTSLMKRVFGDGDGDSSQPTKASPPLKVSLDSAMASELRKLSGPGELPHYTAIITPPVTDDEPLESKSSTEPMFRIPTGSPPKEPSQPGPARDLAPSPEGDFSPGATQLAIPGRWQQSPEPSFEPEPIRDPIPASSTTPRKGVKVWFFAIVFGALLVSGLAMALFWPSSPGPPLTEGRRGEAPLPGADASTLEATPGEEPAELEDGSPNQLVELPSPPESEEHPARVLDAALSATPPPPSRDASPTVSRQPPPLARGWVRVATRPHYAEVFIDGRRRGTTPLLIQLPAGRHRIRLVNSQLGRSEQRSVSVRASNSRSAPAVVMVDGF